MNAKTERTIHLEEPNALDHARKWRVRATLVWRDDVKGATMPVPNRGPSVPLSVKVNDGSHTFAHFQANTVSNTSIAGIHAPLRRRQKFTCRRNRCLRRNGRRGHHCPTVRASWLPRGATPPACMARTTSGPTWRTSMSNKMNSQTYPLLLPSIPGAFNMPPIVRRRCSMRRTKRPLPPNYSSRAHEPPPPTSSNARTPVHPHNISALSMPIDT